GRRPGSRSTAQGTRNTFSKWSGGSDAVGPLIAEAAGVIRDRRAVPVDRPRRLPAVERDQRPHAPSPAAICGCRCPARRTWLTPLHVSATPGGRVVPAFGFARLACA